MKIRHIRALEGPNLFHHQPVLSMALDLGDLHDRSSDEMPEFVARLLDALPGLHSHRCSVGKPGGFVERLHRGTYFGHIVEHVALHSALPRASMFLTARPFRPTTSAFTGSSSAIEASPQCGTCWRRP